MSKHERRVVGHVSGWQEQMNACVCGNPWPCVALTPGTDRNLSSNPNNENLVAEMEAAASKWVLEKNKYTLESLRDARRAVLKQMQPTGNETEAQLEPTREHLQKLVQRTADHWLSLQLTHPTQWEGAIDAAMEAACNEIRRLRPSEKALHGDSFRGSPLAENCPKCGLQMFNWPGQMTKCSKCLHEWYMETVKDSCGPGCAMGANRPAQKSDEIRDLACCDKFVRESASEFCATCGYTNLDHLRKRSSSSEPV